jgi:hypothetical protein
VRHAQSSTLSARAIDWLAPGLRALMRRNIGIVATLDSGSIEKALAGRPTETKNGRGEKNDS